MKTTKIMAMLNTPYSAVKKLLESKGYTVNIINDINYIIDDKKQKKTVYIFCGYVSLLNNLKLLRHPPILIESVSIVRHINLNQPVIYLDADIKQDGLVLFKKLDTSKLKKYIKSRFKFKSKIEFEKAQTKHFGNGSELSIILNKFLSTLPDFMYEPTMVSLASAIQKSDYDIFSDYLKVNRVVTDENTEELEALDNYLHSIDKEIKLLVSKSKKINSLKDKKTKLSVQRIRFIIKYFGIKDIKLYQDPEENVNLCERC